ncbi:ADP-ribosylglycohydrolase family protein [Paenibacillus eucommiae]|uniref:ADP-ribosylglycohydrolase n=1 Tax=Paenibacillus eucommiae TaxID=1355755 RepID=A0ABS4J5I0_9BACL|nr:ADP-ribosylglycohydrolase family protein [Paenibacillus eucommiae]MBP1995097.1 ADP-ribosylglycohydrolase [Paenibacillus eucommiae]
MLQLNYETYLNKVHGGWIGKCIGGAVGGLQENNKSLMDYTMDNIFPKVIPPNDDLDLQVLYLQEVLEKKGSRITTEDIGAAFATFNLCMANEYSVAIKNIELGIQPPYSGSFNNHFFRHSMGCPIRSEIWGFICPGHPDVAVQYAYKDGIIDHEQESVYGEQFFAALEAQSFLEHDIHQLIHFGLKYVPEDTELSRCIYFVLDHYSRQIDWRVTRQNMTKRFGSADASYSVINLGITILALLYGESDFTNTMLIAVNCGYDTDCTAATAGAILGVIYGANSIPEFWLQKIGEEMVIGTVDIKRYSDKIIDLAKDTCTAGLSLARDGVIEVQFTDLPADAKPSLPLPIPVEQVELAVSYQGLPSIGYGETSSVSITVTNHADEEFAGQLSIAPAAALLSSVKEIEVRILPKSEFILSVDFEVKADIESLPQRNINFVKLVKDGAGVTTAITEKSFGLSGAARMKVIGPFWDNYDTTRYESDPYNGLRPDTLHAMFNGYVNLDKPYIDESFADLHELECELVNMHEDKISPDRFIHYAGPSCIYLVHEIICPEDRLNAELLIGNEGPYKVWVNGKLAMESRSAAMWMPYNDETFIDLKAGINTLVIKLLLIGKTSDFSYVCRNEGSKLHLFTDLESHIPAPVVVPAAVN